MTKRRRVVEAAKPVTVLQLWRQAQQKKFAALTNTRLPTPLCLLPPVMSASSSSNRHENDHADIDNENDDWMQLRTGVYELSGEAGSGKTQVALSLCQRTASAAAASTTSSVEPTALYLGLGGAGCLQKALQRLQQMSETINSSNSNNNPWLFRLLTKALLQRDDWSEFLREADQFFLSKPSIRLVVVDSLADLVRDDHGSFTQFDRTCWLLAWVRRCQILADRYQLSWLLINQQATGVSSKGVWESKPALGLAWAHAVQGSWICHRVSGSNTRRLVLHKSNRFPVGQTSYFSIQPKGVQRNNKTL